MEIPDHIVAELGLEGDFRREDVLGAVEAKGIASDIFGLSSEEFVSALESDVANFTLRKSPANLDDWAFLEISRGADSRCRSLVIPATVSDSPSTGAGFLLVECWVKCKDLIVDGRLVGGMLIMGEDKGMSPWDFYPRFLDSWIVAKSSFRGLGNLPKWLDVAVIQIAPDARLTSGDFPKLKFTNFLIEAVSEVKAKWRFLALYRVFEHGYLSEILKMIQRDFFLAPKETLDSCRTAVESEVKQFDSLRVSSALDAYFERFLDSFDKVKAGNNYYASALDNSIRKDGQLAQMKGKAAKGVLICYKIRCSIVHSGLSAPIFESYQDSSSCLEGILGDLEEATMAFLDVSIS